MKIIELTKNNKRNESIITATFLIDGEIKPMSVSQIGEPEAYWQVERLIASVAEGASIDEVTEQIYTTINPSGRVEDAIKSSKELSDNLVLENGRLIFNGFVLEETLAEHMLSMLDSDNTPKDERLWRSYVRFLDNLHQNVDENIRTQLYRWMQYENQDGHSFAITDDGCFVGYKGCIGTVLHPESQFSGKAYVDGELHVGQIPNPIGSVVSMPRSSVQVDPKVGCSVGLHVGTYHYASNWAPILLLVKVNPRDVVSVPYEANSQKIRVCEYKVLEVTEGPLANMFYEDEFEDDHEYFDYDNKYVEVVYDNGSSTFSGFVVEVYRGSNPGLVIKSEDGEYKHLKFRRINKVDEITSEDEANELEDLIDQTKSGDKVYIEYNDFDSIHGYFVTTFDNAVIVKRYNGKYARIEFDIISHYEII